MKGKYKLERSERRNGNYKVFYKNYFWQNWQPLLDNDGKEVEFSTFQEFSEVTRIESFDRIVMKIGKFSGLGRN